VRTRERGGGKRKGLYEGKDLGNLQRCKMKKKTFIDPRLHA